MNKATSLQVKFTGRKCWGRWVHRLDRPTRHRRVRKICREEGPAVGEATPLTEGVVKW